MSQLTNLDLTELTNLEKLNLSNNSLVNLDLANNEKLKIHRSWHLSWLFRTLCSSTKPI